MFACDSFIVSRPVEVWLTTLFGNFVIPILWLHDNIPNAILPNAKIPNAIIPNMPIYPMPKYPMPIYPIVIITIITLMLTLIKNAHFKFKGVMVWPNCALKK